MPSEGVEIPSHPPAEAAPSVASSPEAKKEVSDRQRAKNAVAEGAGFIKSKYDTGFFDAGNKIDAKKDAEKVLGQVGGNNLDSDGLKAFFKSMSAIGGETDEVSKKAAENMRVKVGDRMLTLDEWRAELEAAQKPVDGRAPDPETVKELEDGVFAYSFPKTTDENPESASIPKEKSPEDKLVDQEIVRCKKLFEQRVKEQGDNPNEKDLQAFVLLSFAEEAKGEAGIVVKHEALRNLRDEHGRQELDGAINDLQKKVPDAIEKVCKLMPAEMALEFRNAVAEGELAKMIENGKLSKIEGMRELLFGKDFKEEDFKKILELGKKKKWKNALLLALVIMLIGPVEFGKQAVETPR